MATINYAQKEISCKIVYYGPGLGGKTTNLQFIYKTLPNINRGELVSLATQQDRTLFFDFLPMDLGKIRGFNTKFHLYTVPGQVYYNATRKLVLRGVDGIVFVADSQKDRMDENIKSFENLRENLKEYNYKLENIPWVIQYNKRDLENVFSISEMETLLNENKVPSFESVATNGKGVKESLKSISGMILERLKVVADEKAEGVATVDVHTRKKAKIKPPSPKFSTDVYPKLKIPKVKRQKSDVSGSYLFSEEDPITGMLPIEQICSLYWRGIKVGSASLKLSHFQSSASRVRYRLKGELKILAFFRRILDKKLIYRGKRSKIVFGEARFFFYLTDPPESRAPLAEPFCLWIREKGEKAFYLSNDTKYGKIWINPRGERRLELEE